MTGRAFDVVVSELERRGHRVRRHGSYATTRCTHPGADNPEALSIFDNGSRVKLTCFTQGCEGDEIAESIGLTWRDLYHDSRDNDLARYHYDDGRVVHRRAGKKFGQTNTNRTPTLYRLAKVTEAVQQGSTIYLVEGEEDVHSLETLGAIASTAPMGARNFDKVDVSALAGADIIAIPDNDDEGTRWAELVTQKLEGIAKTLRFAHPAYGKDASDHIARRLGLDDFLIDDPDAERRQATLSRYPALDLAALMDPARPPREYVIDGLLPAGAAVSLAAPAGTGKSLLSLAVALAVSKGWRHFAGLTIPKQRRVLYVDMENTGDDLAERFESFGIKGSDSLRHLTYLSLPELPPLDTQAGGAELLAIINAYQIGANDLVVLDSLQRVIQGEENAADTMRAYYLHTGIKLKRAGVTSLRLDNTGKDVTRGSRGTSGKRDDVDLELVMAPDEEMDDQFRISVNKSRLSDIAPLTLTRYVNYEGQTVFSTADDSFRSTVNIVKNELDKAGLASATTIAEARDVLGGRNYSEKVVRVAVRERRSDKAPICATCNTVMADIGDGSTTHPGCEAA